MRVLHIASGKYLEALISSFYEDELANSVKESFYFDWEKEFEHDIYKITLVNDPRVLGLMSIQRIPGEQRIEIRLLESARENKGKHKQYDMIAGCLIATACQLSFENGFMGFVSLKPKTELIKLYVEKYNFSPMGNQLFVSGSISETLISKYLEND